MKSMIAIFCVLILSASLTAGVVRAADDCEYNDTTAAAVPIAPNPCLQVTGWIEFTGDNDFFAFTAESGDRAWISTRSLSGTDTLLYLYGPDGLEVDSDDDDGEGYNSIIDAAPLEDDGTYSVQLNEYGNNSLLNYSVYFTVMGNDVRETEDGTPNDVYTDAQEIDLNNWVLGTLSSQTDVDFYKLWVDSSSENIDVIVQLSDDPYRDGFAGSYNAALSYYYLAGGTTFTRGAESNHEGTGPDEPEDLLFHSTTSAAGWQWVKISNTATSITSPAYYAVSVARIESHVCVETPSPVPTATTTPPATPSPIPSRTPAFPTHTPTARLATPSPRPTLIPSPSPVPRPTRRPPPFVIKIYDGVFLPADASLPNGTWVVWDNKGSLFHTTSSFPPGAPGSWNSGTLASGDDYKRRFIVSGSFPYRCLFSGQTGIILIETTPTPVQTPTPMLSPTPTAAPSPSPTPTCGPDLPIPDFEIASGDYDGDGDADVAVFRPSAGLWAARDITRVYFGTAGDRPVCGDHNGDADSDFALFKPSTGLWAVPGLTRFFMGGSADFAVPRDYDGDGTVEAAVFRTSTGMWRIRDVTTLYYGSTGDHPVPARYSGGPAPEIALYRPSSGMWAISDYSRIYFGAADDWPLPADYDGDGTTEAAIFRPSGGLWAVNGLTRLYYGCCTDYPIPSDFDGDGTVDIGLFRDSQTLWAVRDLTRAYYGAEDDIPVTK